LAPLQNSTAFSKLECATRGARGTSAILEIGSSFIQ